jgi:hypothetical protein
MQGGLGWLRKDIIGLARFDIAKMKALHYLIFETRWTLAESLRFLNRDLTAKVWEELKHHCYATPGLYYTESKDGFDLSVRACTALAKKIRG